MSRRNRTDRRRSHPRPAATEAAPASSTAPGRRRRLRRGLVAGAAVLVSAGLFFGIQEWRRVESFRVVLRAQARGDLDATARLAVTHLARHPRDRAAALVAARALGRQGRGVEADIYFARAGALSAEDQHLRALGLVTANERARAIEAYEAMLAERPDDLLAMRRLAAVRISENQPAEVRALARRLIAHPRGAVVGHTLDGVVHHNLGEWEAAVASFERVLELDPELREMPLSPPAMFWSYLAKDLMAVSRPDRARDLLTRALATSSDAGLMNDLGRAHDLCGDLEAADRCWRQAAEWAPQLPTPWLNLGRQALRRNDPEAAAPLLERAVALAPRAYEPLYSLSLARRQLGQVEEAERLRLASERLRRPEPTPSSPVP